MRRRVLSVVGYAVIGAILGVLVAASIMVLGAALFWLVVFGDNEWPARAEMGLVAAAYGAGLLVFVGVLRRGWRWSGPH